MMGLRITSNGNMGTVAVVATLRPIDRETGIVSVCAHCYPWYNSRFGKISHSICPRHRSEVWNEWLAEMDSHPPKKPDGPSPISQGSELRAPDFPSQAVKESLAVGGVV